MAFIRLLSFSFIVSLIISQLLPRIRIYTIMLFNTCTLAVVLSLVSLVVAIPGGAPPCTTISTVVAPSPTVTSISQCNTGNAKCCNSIAQVSIYKHCRLFTRLK